MTTKANDDTDVAVYVQGISCNEHEVRMTSQEYGTEIFKYDTLSDALMGAVRLLEKALELDDGVKRTIWVSCLHGHPTISRVFIDVRPKTGVQLDCDGETDGKDDS